MHTIHIFAMVYTAAIVFALITVCSTIAQAQEPLKLSTFANKRVLFISAHPDDIEGYAGGTVAALKRMNLPNLEIKYLILTSGNAGGLCYNVSYTAKQSSIVYD
jgi:hypothetical protein